LHSQFPQKVNFSEKTVDLQNQPKQTSINKNQQVRFLLVSHRPSSMAKQVKVSLKAKSRRAASEEPTSSKSASPTTPLRRSTRVSSSTVEESVSDEGVTGKRKRSSTTSSKKSRSTPPSKFEVFMGAGDVEIVSWEKVWLGNL
jgi:hypothetical protein